MEEKNKCPPAQNHTNCHAEKKQLPPNFNAITFSFCDLQNSHFSTGFIRVLDMAESRVGNSENTNGLRIILEHFL